MPGAFQLCKFWIDFWNDSKLIFCQVSVDLWACISSSIFSHGALVLWVADFEKILVQNDSMLV